MSAEKPWVGRIQFAPLPEPFRRQGQQIASDGDTKAFCDLWERGQVEQIARQNAAMAEKLHKVANWLDRLAESSESSAKTCNFTSLVEAYKADARNYRKTAADIRSVLPAEGGRL